MIFYPSKRIVSFLALFVLSSSLYAQKTLSLAEAEAILVANNPLINASGYNLVAAAGQTRQASLRPNPTAYLERGFYRPQTKEFFPSSAGNIEYVANLIQPLQTARKRQLAVEVSKALETNVVYSNLQLKRDLIHQLRVLAINYHFNKKNLDWLTSEISSFGGMVKSYEDQEAKGNLSSKEVLRLRAFLFSLESDKTNLASAQNQTKSDIITLLGYYKDSIDVIEIDSLANQLSFSISGSDLTKYQSELGQNRADLLAYKAYIQSTKENLRLQKALRYPDINFQASYDMNGSVYQHYNGIGVGLPLPVFNRNQGNIQSAQAMLQASEQTFWATENSIKLDLNAAWSNYQLYQILWSNYRLTFTSQYESMTENMTLAYKRKTISLIEFIDFMEGYKSARNAFYTLGNQRLSTLEQLQYLAGLDKPLN